MEASPELKSHSQEAIRCVVVDENILVNNVEVGSKTLSASIVL